MKMEESYDVQKLIVDARKHYEEALEEYKKRQDNSQVIEILKQIITLDPENIDKKLELASTYQKTGNYEKAEETYLEISQYFFGKENYIEAAKVLEEAFQKLKSTLILKTLVNTLNKFGQTNKAIELIKESLTQKPNSIDVLIILGQAYLIDNRLDEAEKIFAELFSKNDSHYIYNLELAKIYVQARNFDKAIEILNLILDTALRNNKKRQLVELIGTILKENPEHLASIKCLVDIYKKLGDIDNLNSNLNTLIKVAYQESNIVEIIEILEYLIEVNPEETSYKRELERLKSISNANSELAEQSVNLQETPLQATENLEEPQTPLAENLPNFSLEDWAEEPNQTSDVDDLNEVPETFTITNGQIELTGIFGTQPSTSSVTVESPVESPVNTIEQNSITLNPVEQNPVEQNLLAFNPITFGVPANNFIPSKVLPSRNIKTEDLAHLVKKNQPLEREWRRAIRANNEISIIAIRIDQVETYEKLLGTATIDGYTEKISEAIEDILYRGGDQLLICDKIRLGILLLPETSSKGAEIIAHRIGEIVLKMKLTSPNLEHKITVSQAIATMKPKRLKTPMMLIEKIVENLEKISDVSQIIV
jgi:tetratricopeptide (TPR) repeat protein/GGDEF domain-containing protein